MILRESVKVIIILILTNINFLIMNPNNIIPTTPPDTQVRNPNNDGKGLWDILFKSAKADNTNKFTKKQKAIIISILAIASIMLGSFLIPDSFYKELVALLLFNVVLLIIFIRDIYLYIKASCPAIRYTLCLTILLLLLNITDLLFDLSHNFYMNIGYGLLSVSIIVLCLWALVNKKQ